MVFALAGRRIDDDSNPSLAFPLGNVDVVRRRLRRLFQTCEATAVVSSAACGADLCGLLEAGALGLRRRVVLPFDPPTFRKSSVIDFYDRVLDEVSAKDDLVVLKLPPAEPDPYRLTNKIILDEAAAIAKDLHDELVAAVAWDMNTRGTDDATAIFRDMARERSLRVLEISTL